MKHEFKALYSFLKQLQNVAGKPIIVVVDNARYHHSNETQAFVASQKHAEQGALTMAFLPAYSPELNPDEQVWNHAKSRLPKLSIPNKETVKRRFKSILQSIQKTKSLIRSFFEMKDTLYIKQSLV